MKKQLILLIFSLLVAISLSAQSLIDARAWQKLNQTLYAISNLYVDTINEDKLVEDAIVGMLEKLDPHSVYIPAKEAQRANEGIEGSFDGIGVQFQMLRDTLLVVQSISGCPAEKVGVLMGDKIIAVDGKPIAGVQMATTDIMKLLRGKRGTKVNVRIVRGNVSEPIDFIITRDKIPVHSLDAAYMIAPSVGYIKLNSFSATTMQEYKEAYTKLKKQGMKKLMLDLQSNGGGLLPAAIELSDELLSEGKIIVYTEGVHHPRTVAESTSNGDFEQGDLVILVDEYSASASEIVSGAVQDWDRGIIIGRRTFGKGLVQRRFPLKDGSEMRLTVARYYTPSGRNIQKPYDGGSEKYHKELLERYKHGELQYADSIIFPDSLIYKTMLLKRTVYGGGGIMPDIFVPIDTAAFTAYHRNIVAKGIMNKTIMEFSEQSAVQLKQQYPTFEMFEKSYMPDEVFLKTLIANGEKDGVIFDAEQYAKSEKMITLQIKALLARNLFENSDYYRIMNLEDPVIQKGLQVLDNYKEYLKPAKK